MSHPPSGQQPGDGYQPPQYQPQPGQQPYQGGPQGQYYPPQQPPKKKGGLLKWGLGCLGLIVVAIIAFSACAAIVSTGASDDGGDTEQSSDTGGGAVANTEESPEAVEANGSVVLDATATGAASSNYGPLGSSSTADFSGAWSEEIVDPADDETYGLTIQDSSGSDSAEVTCTITVDGEVVDEQTATGPYSLATCTQPLF